MLKLRYLLQSFSIEDFEITMSHEEAGFELLKALARLAEYSLKAYHNDKAEANYLDFQDLQLMVLRLFTDGKHNHILDELQDRFLYIMIDEFQDTNDLQWRIIQRIAADKTGTVVKPKLLIVGDEKQAIYSFRGGDVCLFSRVRRELIQANRAYRYDRQPFDLTSDRGFDYQAEYRRKQPDIHLTQAGEIVFADNFRSAEVPINFINLFFHDLLRRPVYEEYDRRPGRQRTALERSPADRRQDPGGVLRG